MHDCIKAVAQVVDAHSYSECSVIVENEMDFRATENCHKDEYVGNVRKRSQR